MSVQDHNSFSKNKCINVRVVEAGPLDKNVLYDMDLKCFDFPWEPQEWQDWFQGQVVLIAEMSPNLPSCQAVGFAACTPLRDGLFIEKIGVKPGYRWLGISKDLLLAAQLHAHKQMWPHVVTTSIPETFLIPGAPDDVSGWVKKVGFKARLPLNYGEFEIMGQSINGVPCVLE